MRLRDFSTDSRIVILSGLAMGLGIVSTVAARVLLSLIYFFTQLFFFQRVSFAEASPVHNQWGPWVILIPMLGALIVGLMARFGSEQIRGHGIPEAIESILLRGSRVDPRVAWLKPLSSAISIGSGGPFGAEGPIIMTGGSLGSVLAQHLHLTSSERKTLLVAGAAAGMAAVFNSPVAATLLAVELMLFEWRPASLVPVALASATASVFRQFWMGPAPPFVVQHSHPALAPSGLIASLLCGLLAAGLVCLLTWALYAIEDGFSRLTVHWMWWPCIGAILVGLGGYLFPDCLGVGYDVILRLLGDSPTWKLVLGVLFFKSGVWLVALGSGTSGGILAPVLMIGAALGWVEGQVLPHMGAGYWPILSMGGVLAGCLSSPFTALVFCLEVTRDYQTALGLLITTCTSHGLTSLWLKRSIMTEKIARRGYHLTREHGVDPLEFVFVREAVRRDTTVWNGDEAVDIPGHQGLVARVDEQGNLLGVVRRQDLLHWWQDDGGQRAPEILQPVVTSPDQSLLQVERLMAETGLTTLPVVDQGCYRGLITLRDLLTARSRIRDAEARRQVFLGPYRARKVNSGYTDT